MSDADKMRELERRILQQFSGLQREEFNIYDVPVGEKEVMHCSEAGRGANKPRLLMLHGFGGNNVVFYRMLGTLAREYHVISVDLPGMGFNSRPKKPFDSTDSCIYFMVSSILRFVDALRWDKFDLLGHSMGAFFGAHFFDRFPDRVGRLYLISPAGFNSPHQLSKKRAEERLEQAPFYARFFAKRAINSVMEEKQSPFELSVSFVRNFAIKKYFGHRRFRLEAAESEAMISLTQYLINLPQCGERCLGHVLYYGVNSPKPIIEIIKRHRDRLNDISLIYGQSDWMDTQEVFRNLEAENIFLRRYTVSNSDHQIPFQNPQELAQLIVTIKQGKSEDLEAVETLGY